MEITKEVLDSFLSYDENTGNLIWRVSASQRIKIGDVAGSILTTRQGRKYLRIKLLGKSYLAHRLAWTIFYGSPPSKMIDHDDGNGLNNRILNLRDVSRKENNKNSKMREDNSSGFNGVYYHKQRNKWVAYMTIDKKMKYLGIFKDKKDAIECRKINNVNYGFHKNHGIKRAIK